RRDDVDLTVLRFANFIGPGVASTLTRYFSLPLIPTALGYDPRLQMIHEEDAVEALNRVVRGSYPGTFNVAADGVVLLSQALRLLGRPSLPLALPLATPVASLLRRFGLVDFSTEQLRLLIYGRVADNTRMEREMGFRPARTTREALLDFAEGEHLRRLYSREQVEEWEREARAFLRRKAQERFEKARS
ncbi:MAG TPA: NAD-dependent dehydratase, partial [Actinomycetota bacterium]